MRIFWNRIPLFTLVFSLRENFCHCQFCRAVGQCSVNASLTSVQHFYLWLNSICMPYVCGGSICVPTEGLEAMENKGLFWFQMCIYSHMVLVLAHIPQDLTGDLWHCSLRLTWFWLPHSGFSLTPLDLKVQRSQLQSSKLTQCVKLCVTPQVRFSKNNSIFLYILLYMFFLIQFPPFVLLWF